ncbi:MAG: hypothetical protein ABSA44_07650 [Bacteroidota bacterium]|jgi:hypothetical protein
MSKHRHSAEQITTKLRYARDAVTLQDIHLSKLECYKRQIIIGLPRSSTLLQDVSIQSLPASIIARG